MSGSLSGYDAFSDFTPAIEQDIEGAAAQYDESPDMLANLFATESSFNPSATNPNSSATGIGQFINSTAQEYGVDPLNAESSIYGTAAYLNDLGVQSNPAQAISSYGTNLTNYNNNAAQYDPAAAVVPGGNGLPSESQLSSGNLGTGGVDGGAAPAPTGVFSGGGVWQSLGNLFSFIGNHPTSALILVVSIIGLMVVVVGYAIQTAGIPSKWTP